MATAPIADQVIDFYSNLFEQLFSEPFRPLIKERLKRNAVERQVAESSDAASQSLIRFYLNQQLTVKDVVSILAGYSAVNESLDLDRISNPNVTPESLVEELLKGSPIPGPIRRKKHDSVYRVGLHSILQVLMLVGPVMAEWRKLGFSSTFELPRRVVNRLNEISEQLDALGLAGESVADENYELTYRDYLLQRFHRVEAGTVRMTTSLNVDLRELFVMPRLKERPTLVGDGGQHPTAAIEFMGLREARNLFVSKASESKEEAPSALKQAKRCARLVVIGAPGSGKSTFLEWLQLKVAAVEEEVVLAGKQAIPLLLRVRQLDPEKLPLGAGLIERATASRDRATLMPAGWIERQMQKGRVLLMLDGLDEAEPELRDKLILPWLDELCTQYPDCHYLVSSRPVGYSPGALRSRGFVEADLVDFGKPEIAEYTCHWCTAIRLAQNEPEAEARREGAAEGQRIVESFQSHPYISNLARNPLMLSAICLVNYFERGRLPEDRAVLYRLCVEGMLHHWDQRRGIQSEFTLEEKLRACREVALAMQTDDRAEYPAERVREVFAQALGDNCRAEELLEHVRYRTGLLLERRAGIFAFAHLTFQEYLAARAVYEGSSLRFTADGLTREHMDARWREVIALYCGLVPSPTAREVLEDLMDQEDNRQLSGILADAYLSAGPALASDQAFREKILERIAALPMTWALERFPIEVVAPVANAKLGSGLNWPSEALVWLVSNPDQIDWAGINARLASWQTLPGEQLSELVFLAHAREGPAGLFQRFVEEPEIYSAAANIYDWADTQAGVAFRALGVRSAFPSSAPAFDAALLQLLRVPIKLGTHEVVLLHDPWSKYTPDDPQTWSEFVTLARRLTLELAGVSGPDRELTKRLDVWASALEKQLNSGRRVRRNTKGKRNTSSHGARA